MYAFTLDRPSALDAAVAAAAGGGQVLAGGQTLLPSMKMRLSQPGHLVDLGGVKEIDAARNAVVHDGVRGGFVHLLTEGHGAQRNRGDVQIALTQANRGEVEVFHEGEFSWAQRMKRIYYVWCAVPGRVCLR